MTPSGAICEVDDLNNKTFRSSYTASCSSSPDTWLLSVVSVTVTSPLSALHGLYTKVGFPAVQLNIQLINGTHVDSSACKMTGGGSVHCPL